MLKTKPSAPSPGHILRRHVRSGGTSRLYLSQHQQNKPCAGTPGTPVCNGCQVSVALGVPTPDSYSEPTLQVEDGSIHAESFFCIDEPATENLGAERTVQAAPRPEAQPRLLGLDSGSGLGDLKALKAWKDLIANPPKSIRGLQRYLELKPLLL